MRTIRHSRLSPRGWRSLILAALTVACNSPTESTPEVERPGDSNPTVGWTLGPVCSVLADDSRPVITGAQLLLGTRIVRDDRFSPKHLVPLSEAVENLPSGLHQLSVRITGLTVPSANLGVSCNAMAQHSANPLSNRILELGYRSGIMRVGDVVTFPVEIPATPTTPSYSTSAPSCTYLRVTPTSADVAAEGMARLRIDAVAQKVGAATCAPLRVRVSPSVAWLVPHAGVDGMIGQGPRGFTVAANPETSERAVTIEFFTTDARGTRSIVGRTRVRQVARADGPRVVTYTTFDGAQLERWSWLGRHVALLTARADLDRPTMTRILAGLDAAYEYYAASTGQIPQSAKLIEGRLPITEVNATCGAGCGYLGATGIELLPGTWSALYEGVRTDGRFEQTAFYELGRNFWFLSAPLAYRAPDPDGAVVTGFAVYMRFASMAAAGIEGAPFNGTPFPVFRSTVEGLVDRYVADATLNWSNTLRVGRGVANPMGLGATDLFASMVMRLARDHGGDAFVQRLWKAALGRPTARSSAEAAWNFADAASIAAGRDLTAVFQAWRWPAR